MGDSLSYLDNLLPKANTRENTERVWWELKYFKLQYFVLFVFYNLSSFIIIVRFISAPEITTTEGKSNVNSIRNCSTFF